jgi:EAL and modified HD-GYP domain-containing signal transduction protein
LTTNFYNSLDGDAATSNVITNSFLVIGINSLTQGKKAFINFTENTLKQDIVSFFSKDVIAIEVLENIEPDSEIVEICKNLKKMGYTIALDDFVFAPKYKPLMKIADIIKIDFMQTPPEQREWIIKEFKTPGLKFLAEKVETREDFDQGVKLGYSYFQGYFFSKPIIVSGQDLPSNKLNYIQLLKELYTFDPDFEKLTIFIERDVSLSYKLLRLINSAAFYLRNRITSIKHALVLLGLQEIKKWISLVALRDIGDDKPDELVKNSIIRARFGELLGPKFGLRNRRDEIFLMGMFSMIDALMNKPIEDILKELPISKDIEDALLGKDGLFKDILDLIVFYEKGEWDNLSSICNKLNISDIELPDIYLESLQWTNDIFSLQ